MAAPKPLTLAVDIGGTHIKASVLDATGRMTASELRLPTPAEATPKALLGVIATVAKQLPDFDRVSAGFPGYVIVDEGVIKTAPNLGTEAWRGFALAEALSTEFGKPARVLNDADVQGLGVIAGKGLELVLTLGTGIGSALFKNGLLLPHLELGQHPVWKRKTYYAYLGDAALKRKGPERWNRRLRRVIGIVDVLVNYDTLYLGGGNSRVIDFALPENVKRADNIGGITGGVRLWDPMLDELFPRPKAKK